MNRRDFMAVMAAGMAAAGTRPGRAAAELKLYHDKYFWQDFFTKMAGFAAGRGHAFTPTPYATDQYQAFIASGLQAGNAPDLFSWWNGTKLGELVEAGAVAPLDELWHEMIAQGQADSSVADLLSVGGHVYGVPLSVNYWGVAYNKALFGRAGVEPPTTWDGLMQTCETLKSSGITPFNATTQDGWRGFIWFQELLLRSDPAAYAALGTGRIGYTSAPIKKVFALWGDLYARGYFTPATSNEEFLDFARGKAAMYLIGDWAYANLRQGGLEPGTGFGAFVMPNMETAAPPAVIIEAAPILLSKKGASNEDVMAFARWWMSAEAAAAWGDYASLNIGNPKAAKPNPVVASLADEVARTHATPVTRYWEASPSDIVLPAVEQFNRFMVTPTPAMAETCMASIERVASEYWAAKK